MEGKGEKEKSKKKKRRNGRKKEEEEWSVEKGLGLISMILNKACCDSSLRAAGAIRILPRSLVTHTLNT